MAEAQTSAVRRRARINLVLDPACKALLDRTANAGRYVDRLLLAHDRRWRLALALVRGAGWTEAEIYAASEALRPLESSAAPEDIAACLRAGAISANQSWGDALRDWHARVRACEADGSLALAVLAVAAELGAGNLDIAEAISSPA